MHWQERPFLLQQLTWDELGGALDRLLVAHALVVPLVHGLDDWLLASFLRRYLSKNKRGEKWSLSAAMVSQ